MASYDQTAAEFAARWGELRLQRELGTFAHHVGGQCRVLDRGCGPGRDVTYYQPAEIETALRQAGFEILESWINPDRAGRDEPWLNAIARMDVQK